jgi:multidrug transporter EmrE-like cation transporter
MSAPKKSKTNERLCDLPTDSRQTKADLIREIERLSDRIGILEKTLITLATNHWVATMSAEITEMNVVVGRAQKKFRRLANGLIVLCCLTLTALLGVVFQGKVSLVHASLIGIAAVVLAIAGYVFHGDADRMGTRDTKT